MVAGRRVRFRILRYTDVLLMYTEAKTMLGDIDQSVFDILDAVRPCRNSTCGSYNRPEGYDENHQDERKWEFAFEGVEIL